MDIIGIKYALNSALGDSGFQALNELINAKIASAISSINKNTNNRTAAGAVKIIKSVQRGVYAIEYENTSGGNTITINSVDTSKCIVLFQGDPMDAENQHTNQPYIYSLTSTQIKLGFSVKTPSRYGKIGWQVIEFY